MNLRKKYRFCNHHHKTRKENVISTEWYHVLCGHQFSYMFSDATYAWNRNLGTSIIDNMFVFNPSTLGEDHDD